MNIGELNIIARVDTTALTAGLGAARQGLENMKAHAKSAFADLERLGSSISGVATGLSKVGLALGGTFLTLTTLFGPQVTPFLEKMKADTQRLGIVLGEELAPVFEKVSNGFSSFVDWMGQGGTAVNLFLDAVGGLAVSAGVAQLLNLIGLSSATPYVIPIVLSLSLVPFFSELGGKLGELTTDITGGFNSGTFSSKLADALVVLTSPLSLIGGGIGSLFNLLGIKPEALPTFGESAENVGAATLDLFGVYDNIYGRKNVSAEDSVKINQQLSQEDVISLAYRNANIR